MACGWLPFRLVHTRAAVGTAHHDPAADEEREGSALTVDAERAAQPAPPAGMPRRVGLVSVHTSPLAQPGTGDGGGLNVTLDALARGLVARGVAVEVFTRAEDTGHPSTRDHVDGGYRVHHLPAGPPQAAKRDLASHLCAFAFALARHPAAAELDVLHTHYWMAGWVGRRVRRRLAPPWVHTFHTLAATKNAALAPGDAPEPALRLVAERRIAAAADLVVCASPGERDGVRRYLATPPGRLRIVPPGVDTQVFHPGRPDPADLPIDPAGGPIVLFAGRLQPLKGPDLAVRALAALAERERGDPAPGPPARLVVVGGTSGNGAGVSDPARLRGLAAELGVADRVTVLDARPHTQLADLYRAARTVIVPSRTETFGLVALEAQACGTPVVAADVDGLRHAVGPGAGRLVAGHDPEAFAAALHRLVRDDAAHAAASRAALAHAAGHTWDDALDRVVDVYAAAADHAAHGGVLVGADCGA